MGIKKTKVSELPLVDDIKDLDVFGAERSTNRSVKFSASDFATSQDLTHKANEVSNFTEADSRVNITSGDSVTTIWGKIKKWFSDLKTVAFTGSYNDLIDKPEMPNDTNIGNSDLQIPEGVVRKLKVDGDILISGRYYEDDPTSESSIIRTTTKVDKSKSLWIGWQNAGEIEFNSGNMNMYSQGDNANWEGFGNLNIDAENATIKGYSNITLESDNGIDIIDNGTTAKISVYNNNITLRSGSIATPEGSNVNLLGVDSNGNVTTTTTKTIENKPWTQCTWDDWDSGTYYGTIQMAIFNGVAYMNFYCSGYSYQTQTVNPYIKNMGTDWVFDTDSEFSFYTPSGGYSAVISPSNGGRDFVLNMMNGSGNSGAFQFMCVFKVRRA
jgi:hypothetical protein